MKLILVCGPWSSGTTAVSGILKGLGLDGFGPYFETNDHLTPNSLESLAFREVLRSFVSEKTLARTKDPTEIIDLLMELKARLAAHRTEKQLSDETQMFLKHPLAALVLPEIAKVFETRLIYVLRPIAKIEATRRRRNWKEIYGAKGAGAIYSKMFNFLVNESLPTLILRYSDVLSAPYASARQLATFAGLTSISSTLINEAAAAIRKVNQASRQMENDRV